MTNTSLKNESNQVFQSPRFWGLVSVILIGVLFRILPHPPNFSPITAMALFAGATFSRKLWAIVIPLVAMFLSDLVLGFHETMFAVYGAFILVACLGFALSESQRSVGRIAGSAVAGSLLFFVITNFAVWASGHGGMYPMTTTGLVACFVAGLEFLPYSLVGDLVFTGVFFGAWSFVEKTLPAVRAA